MKPLTPEGLEDHLSLRARMPDYLATFGIGLLVSAAVGIVVWLISDIPLASTVGHTVAFYGVALLVAGGIAGGGYTVFDTGAMESLSRSRSADELRPQTDPSLGTTPQEQLHRRRRPEANPGAFWQVVGGMVYFALGLFVVIIGG